MIYQDVYSSIQQPTSMYGLRKQVEQDQLAEQEKQLALQQKQRADIISRGQLATQALVGFKDLSPQQKAAQWNTYRQRIESLVPETKGILPSVWDSNDPSNEAELDSAISGLSKTYFKPEQTKLGADETLFEATYGVDPKEIARGTGKPNKSIFGRQILPQADNSTIMLDIIDLPSGSQQQGSIVKDARKPNSVIPVEEYYKMYPEDWPYPSQNPYSQKKPINSPTVPPTAPMAVPGQTELQPRQFNTPSPNNRAGETNVGYPIDENAMLQQPQIMPTMGNSMLRGAGAVMADEFAPQPRNALVGGMMPQPSQFAELMPAGSTPNRLGSPGVEGIDFATTGGYKQEVIPGGMRFSSPPKPTKPDNPKDRLRPATADELANAGIPTDTGLSYLKNETTGEITPVERLDKLDQARKVIENAEALARQGIGAAEKEKAQAQAEQARLLLRTMRSAQMSAIRQVVDVENDLLSFAGSEFVDTGPLDTFARFTGTATGKKLSSLDRKAKAMNNAINHAIKITGAGSQSDADVALMLNVFPDSKTQYPDNMYVIGELKKRMMDYIGLDAVVRTDDDFNAIPNGSIFYDSRSQTILRKIKD